MVRKMCTNSFITNTNQLKYISIFSYREQYRSFWRNLEHFTIMSSENSSDTFNMRSPRERKNCLKRALQRTLVLRKNLFHIFHCFFYIQHKTN